MHVVPDLQPCRMSDLALSFPTLKDAEGLYPFDATTFDAWACGPRCHGARLAAQFILAIYHGRIGKLSDKPRKTPDKHTWWGVHRWNIDSHWRVGPFDVVGALSTWDAEHRAAFIAWASAPWWP